MQESASAAPKRRQHSLATDLVTELSQRILLGKIAPGQKLPSENQIVREHGVSRTVVREAISKLQASGLVVTHHGIGTFVLERGDQTGLRLKVETVSRVRDIIELRIGLETQAVALAAVRRTDEQLAAMRQALDDYQDLLANDDSCVEADKRFHMLIAEPPATRISWKSCNIWAARSSRAAALRPASVLATTSRIRAIWPIWNTKHCSAPFAAKTRTPPVRRCGRT